MKAKQQRYILDYLLAIIATQATLLLLFAAVCVLLRRGDPQILLVAAAALAAVGGVALFFFRTCRKALQKDRQMMELYATGYTISDVCRLDCYFSRGTEVALKKAVDLLDTGKLLSISKRQAQYLALQNQINPHFLYNTLEGIRSEAVAAGLDIVADMTEYLARFFRYTVSKVENLVPVSEELENIRTYFAIQQFRFGDRLHLEIVCPSEDAGILDCQMPKLTLQPIVENAIIHGLELKLDAGILTVHLALTEKRLLVQVSDNGVGMNAETLRKLQDALCRTSYEYIDSRSGAGIALLNVNNRIRLLFGEEYGITIRSNEGLGTDVIVTLPAGCEPDPAEETP